MSADQKTTEQGKKVLGGCLIFVALVVVFYFFNPCGLLSRAATGGTSALGPGDDATVGAPNLTLVFVATDSDALDQLSGAANSTAFANTAADLAAAGRVFPVPNNSPVRIVDTSGTAFKIRMTSGKDINREGWVVREWVK